MLKYFLCMLCAYLAVVQKSGCQDQPTIDSLQASQFIDSLITAVEYNNNEDMYPLLHGLSANYIDVDNEKAWILVKQAEAVAFASGDSLSIVKSQRLKGQILFKLGKPQAAIAITQPLLEHWNLQNKGNEYLTVSNLLGVCHLTIGEFDKALYHYLQTKTRAEMVGDKEYAAISLKNIGIAYYKLKDYQKALPFMMESYEMEQSLNSRSFATPMNISLCYSHLGEYDKAQAFLRESMAICGKDCGLLPLVHIKYASGCMFYGLKEFVRAEADFVESLNFAKLLDDSRMELDNICMLAKISVQNKEIKNAEYYLKEGESLINVGAPFNVEIIKVYSQLSELYLMIDNFERAAFYQSKYIMLKDSIYNEAVTTNLMEIESKYLQRENEAKIAAQREIILLKEQMLYRQSIFNVVTTLFCVTAIALIVFLFRSYRLKKTMNVLLEEKIRQRTFELDNRVRLLFNMLNEKELELNRFLYIISESINSLKGLTVTGCSEITDSETNEYFRSLHRTVLRLAESTRLFSSRRGGG